MQISFCKKNTSNVYGPNSPFDKMIKKGTKFLSLGLPINLNCSQSSPRRICDEGTIQIQ